MVVVVNLVIFMFSSGWVALLNMVVVVNMVAVRNMEVVVANVWVVANVLYMMVGVMHCILVEVMIVANMKAVDRCGYCIKCYAHGDYCNSGDVDGCGCFVAFAW